MFYIMRLIISEGLRRAVGTRAASHICTEQFINLEINVLSDLTCWGVLCAVFVGLACDATTIPQCTPVTQPTMPSQMRKFSPF